MPVIDDSLEIIPKRYSVPSPEKLFEKKKVGYTIGKSAKYLKDVIIPQLRQENKHLKDLLKKARAKRDDVKRGKSKAIKTVQQKNLIQRRKDYAIKEAHLTQRAKEFFYDKVKVSMIQRSSYLDAVTAYPIIQQWARKEGVPYKFLGLFILINHFNWFKLRDAEAFGYSYNVTSRFVIRLVEMGWVEKFTGRKFTYVPSVKGHNKFLEISKYYDAHLKLMYKRMDKNFVERSGRSGVKVKGKYLSSITDLYE